VKFGIVSDLHCNREGLLRALEIIGDADELVCLGDSICDYRFSNEVVAILRDRGAQVILGNHEEVPRAARRPRPRRGVDRPVAAPLACRTSAKSRARGRRQETPRRAFDAVGAARRLCLSA
jgi:hypothetical protein